MEQPEGERGPPVEKRRGSDNRGQRTSGETCECEKCPGRILQRMMGFQAGMRGTRVSRRLRPLTGTTGRAGPVETGPISLELRWEAEVGAETRGLSG